MSAKCKESNKPCAIHEPEPLESLTVRAARLAESLEQSVRDFIVASDQNLGDIEVQVERQSRELQRQATEKAAQAKADVSPPVCPVCGKVLSGVSRDHGRTFESRFGPITVRRARGYCRRCKKWRFPADTVLGLADTAGYSPRVQEMAALLASKMPVNEASAVLEHLTGVKLPRATLDREARRQGKRARHGRHQEDEQACGVAKKPVQPELVLEPYQMIIQMDAWNIRERDEWGKTKALRQGGKEPERGHLFSPRSPSKDGGGPTCDQRAGLCRDARRYRWLAGTVACRSPAAGLGSSCWSVGDRRRSGVDLASGR